MTPPARQPLVVGNWKMHSSEARARDLAAAVARGVTPEIEVAIAPPFTALRAVAEAVVGTELALAAQDAHWEDAGAYTGEISAAMLADLGVAFVIVGHSERRALFGDSDERVAAKAAAVRRNGMVPIVCVGEQSSERRAGDTLSVVERQLRSGLAHVHVETGVEVVIAYEPVWAIGTGVTATPDQVHEVHRDIRRHLALRYGSGPAGGVRILYGGSVTPQTAQELFDLPEVDGGLIGGASLDPRAFLSIVDAALPPGGQAVEGGRKRVL